VHPGALGARRVRRARDDLVVDAAAEGARVHEVAAQLVVGGVGVTI
jgi:hypothetical protein